MCAIDRLHLLQKPLPLPAPEDRLWLDTHHLTLLLPGEMNISEIQCKIEFNTFSFANPITVTKNHNGGTC